MTNQNLFNRVNHFHLAVKIRSENELKQFYQEKYPKRDPQSFGNFADLLSNQFKNFLISYAKSFNKRYNRKGSLFLDNINRKPVTNDRYYTQLVTYIHQNPVKHGFVEEPSDWPFNSYNIYLSRKQTQLERAEGLNPDYS
jgi:REP element-mobilizing transposase RayT